MTKNEVLRLLRTHKPTLATRFGVTALALFGSFARDQATDRSDMDILVRFDGPATSRSYFGLQFYIEDLQAVIVAGCPRQQPRRRAS